MFFAQVGGKLVGMMSGQGLGGVDEDTVKVGEVFVDKEVRGQGVGKKLLVALIDHIKKNFQIKKIKVKVFTSQLAAIKLYESVGCQIKEEITEHWPDGRTHQTFVMEKIINE
jgi:ribosomal protein S18 acetylase RimI-like enzyme